MLLRADSFRAFLPWRRLILFGSFMSLLSLCGCGGFFYKDTAASTGGSTGTSATNFAFVANTGANTVTGLGISTTGTLSPLSGSPITFSVTPTALAVSRNNGFLWVGTPTQIFGFSVSSTGAIAALNNGTALVNSAGPLDMQTSPDGKWLMVLDSTGIQIELFQINADGTLTLTASPALFPQLAGTVVPRAVRINPAGTTVAAALGTAGEVLFSFDTATGLFTALGQTQPPALTSDNAIAWDSTGTYLYIARSGTSQGLVVNTVAANGALTPTTSTVYATGAQPFSIAIDNTGTNVYVANRSDSTITAYGIGTGAALTAIAGSPFAAGSGASALSADSTGKWLLSANSGGSPDVSLFGFDATTAGKLNLVTSSSTGKTASIMALSH